MKWRDTDLSSGADDLRYKGKVTVRPIGRGVVLDDLELAPHLDEILDPGDYDGEIRIRLKPHHPDTACAPDHVSATAPAKPSRLPPPKGYSSWLAYAIETMDDRSLYNDFVDGHAPHWPNATTRQDMREAAKAELDELLSTQR